jgi:hypothetical protein
LFNFQLRLKRSIASSGTPAGKKKTKNRTNSDPDGDGLIWMLMHGGGGGFRTGDRLITDIRPRRRRVLSFSFHGLALF